MKVLLKRLLWRLGYWIIAKPMVEELEKAREERERLKALIREVIDETKT